MTAVVVKALDNTARQVMRVLDALFTIQSRINTVPALGSRQRRVRGLCQRTAYRSAAMPLFASARHACSFRESRSLMLR